MQTVPWSSLAGDCPPDWPRSLVWRLVPRGSSPVSGVHIEYSCAWCRGTARCRRIHPCCRVLSLILFGLGFIRILFFNSLSRGMPESVFK